ncbi:hypothetical protein OEZ85_003491 [Tetradesmus obliquus]|uniref:AAA+ ATPase domain-containing protein n=1 Tax=Tetradesmus obliquus TaxID=3088 RepID=A0ABY8UBQ7_TETOB|nr:hypothetical protein OEZ85_003491 [Tetradesmus obliquus]
MPLAADPAWRESAAGFGERLRANIQDTVFTDGFQQRWSKLHESLTFMDWTFPVTGLDLSYVWDPEMWLTLKQAVVWNEPELLWNKLWDRISYKSKVPTAGFVGDMRISYAKFLALLERHRIKRLIIYGDMRTAIVEVPHPWSANIAGAPGQYGQYLGPDGAPLGILVPNPAAPDDPSQWFSPEMPEWDMEKYRFYLDLPGDFWESGALLRYLREREVQILWDDASRQYVLPYKHLTKLGEVRTELQLLDAADNWAFLGWLLDERRMQFLEKAAAVCLAIRGVAILTNLLSATSLVRFLRKRRRAKDKKQNMWQRLTRAPAKEFMTRDKSGKLKDTGVRFSDIAGTPGLVFEMREVVKMLLRDPVYMHVGARCPRGIIFQGPPGTGKTYLARAIAGEAGVTFLSAVGSEFVEMFAGVAAARVNSLFHAARQKAPCIIFIDEIDAIGRSRSSLGGDPGSMERESALLSLLVQMDGIHGHLEQVLTIGATNLAQELDQALLRPGRFEVVYEIPAPGPTARLEMLKYHGRNKPIEDEGLYFKVAEVTAGWSAAALANLMNEAAILTVRRSVQKISLPMVLELVEAQEWGPSAPRIPPSEAKDRLAEVTAAKAVAMALTPGIDPIKFVTMWSRRRGQGPYIQFIDSATNLDPAWHPEQVEIMDRATNFKVNAAEVGDEPLGEFLHVNAAEVGDEPLGEFLHVASLLIPLYAARAWEVAEHGPDAASLATAAPIADCFQIAYYCVRNSLLHPRFKRLPPLHTYIMLGNGPGWANARDPLAIGLDEELGFHALTLTLLKAAWRRTQQLVATRADAIRAVAAELLSAEDEKVEGSRLVEIIESTPLNKTDISIDCDFLPIVKEVLGRVPETLAAQAAALDEADRQQQQQQQAADSAAGEGGSSSSSVPDDFLPGVPRPLAAAVDAALKLDDDTLAAVSRAIMGRLDIVDLVGKNTAYEVAERVVESLLDPATVDRLKAVRAYVEQPDGAFPPPPLSSDLAVPLYGYTKEMALEWWKTRHISSIGFRAIDMLYNERQVGHYQQDMDLPWYNDTTLGRDEAAAAASAGSSTQDSTAGDADAAASAKQ